MRKARFISDQLCAIESPISDEALVCELRSKYRPFTRATEPQNSPIGFDELYALLLSEETQLRFHSLQITSVVPPTAHYGNTGCGGCKNRGRGGQGRGYGNSYISSRNNYSSGSTVAVASSVTIVMVRDMLQGNAHHRTCFPCNPFSLLLRKLFRNSIDMA